MIQHMPNDRNNTTIRLTADERREIEEKMASYGFTQVSPFIRFAIRQLKAQKN